MSNTKRSAKGGGMVHKRADGRWEARYTVGFDEKTGKQIRRSVYGKTQKEVRQALNRVMADVEEGTYLEPCSLKLNDWLDTWLKDYVCNIKPATFRVYEQHVRVHLKPYLGNARLTKLTVPAIQRAYRILIEEKGISPKSLKNINGVLHRALSQAQKLGYIRENPVDAVVLPRVEKTQVNTMDDCDIPRFLAAIKGDPYEYVLFTAIFTGLRQGEVLGLTWDCVDWKNSSLLINKQHGRNGVKKVFEFSSLKTEQSRVITVASDVMEVLRKQKMWQAEMSLLAGTEWNNEKNLVFTTEFGRYINNKTLYMNFKRLIAEIGLPDMRFHDLRHTFAVNSLRAGDDIKTVQENLGHATASFTLSTYAHATPGMKRESAARMESFIRSMQSAMPNECKQTI